MSVLKKFTAMNFSIGLANIILLIISILISRSLGPSGKGEYSAALTLSEILIYLLLLGLGNGILFSASKRQSEKSKIAFVSTVLSIFLGLLGTALILFLVFIDDPLTKNIKINSLICVSLLPAIAIPISNLRHLLYAEGRLKEINLMTIFNPVIQLVLILLLLTTKSMNVTNALIAYVATNFLIFIYQQFLIGKHTGYEPNFSREIIKEIFSISLKSYFISLMTFIIIRSDILLLNAIRGNYETGIYSVSAALAGKMLLITSPLYYILSPEVIRDVKGRLEQQLKISRHLVVFLAGLLLLADLLYKPAVNLLYGQKFVESFNSFLILNIGIIFLGLIDVFNPYFLSKKFPAISIIAPLIAALSNILLNLVFIPRYGHIAAAATSSLSYFLYYLLLSLYIRKKEKVSLREFLVINRKDLQELKSRFNRIINR